MLSRPLPALAAVLTCALLAGCQPASPTPTPAPSYQCTPEAGGDTYDCSQAQYDDMVAKDKLYAEAEAVYRKYFDENARILRAGGATEPSDVLRETATGDYLNDSMAQYSDMRKAGQRVRGGEIQLVWLRRTPGESTKGSVVSLEACIDMSTARVVSKNGSQPGIVGSEQVFLGRFDGHLKIQNSAWEELKSC